MSQLELLALTLVQGGFRQRDRVGGEAVKLGYTLDDLCYNQWQSRKGYYLSMARLTLRFFGSFQATLAGQPLRRLHSTRLQALLAYLALEAAQPHSRDELATRFWPDEPETIAKQNLRQALYQLRQALDEPAQPPHPNPLLLGEGTVDDGAVLPPNRGRLGGGVPHLLLTRTTAQFNQASDYTLDVTAFQELIQHQQLTQALALYQGEFLNGLTNPSPLFEEWLVVQREHFHIQALTLLNQLTRQALHQADYSAAQGYARRQLALEPWREVAHRQLITALAHSGDRTAALAQYESCRRVLAAELGVAPDGETEALVAQIRAGDMETRRHETRRHETEDAKQKARDSLPVSQSPGLLVSDWGAAPEIRTLHGRQMELATLHQWVLAERCRLVTVLGMGGMGKTALTVHWARTAAQGDFAVVIWRSLLNAPPLVEVLHDWLLGLTNQQLASQPLGIDALLRQLLDHLRRQRCLLILDNAESILQEATAAGAEANQRQGPYRPGCEAYGQLFQRLGESTHQSCLLITSRELPPEVARLAREMPLVRALALAGLTTEAAKAVLKMQGLVGPALLTQQLVQRYSGNPLALLLVADTIQEIFDGDVATFLQEEAPIFDDIRDVLDQQFARLSPLEGAILFWLALEREPVTAPQLAALFPQPIPKRALLEALNALRRRSLLEKVGEAGSTGAAVGAPAGESGFTLPNVVTEYLTERLVEQICDEIQQGAPRLLKSHSLLKAQAKAYVRQSQARLLLQPICDRLQARLGNLGLRKRLYALLQVLQQEADRRITYAGGNLLNLLLHLQADLGQADFSQLAVWQGYLQGAIAQGINFQDADLTNAVFSDVFSGITALAFSPDGEMLAGGTTNGEICLWRAQGTPADGQSLGMLTGHTNYVWSLLFSADGQQLISCSDDGLIHIWAIRNRTSGALQPGIIVQTLRGHTAGVWRLSLSPDGHTLASGGGDHLICLWDLHTGELRRQLHTQGRRGGVRALAYHPHGALLACGNEEGALQLWDTERGVRLTQVTAHRAMIWFLTFSPDGALLATGNSDNSVQLWSVAELLGAAEQGGTYAGTLPHSTYTLTGHTGRINWLSFSPNGRWLVSGSNDQTVRLWAVPQGTLYATWQAHTDGVGSVVFSLDGKLVASGGGDRTVHVWEVESGHLVRTMQGHIQGVSSISCAPDGQAIATACQDNKVRLLVDALAVGAEQVSAQPTGGGAKARSPSRVLVFTGHTKELSTVAFSPDGALLASAGADHTICLWQAGQGTLHRVLYGHREWVRALIFHPNGKALFSCSSDWSIRVWDLASGEQTHLLQAQKGSTWGIALSPNGETLAAGITARTVYLWPTYQVDQPIALHGHSAWVTAVAFSPDGHLLASASGDQTVRLWDAATGDARGVLTGHTDWVHSVAIGTLAGADGQWLASGGGDHQIRLWELTTGRLHHTLRGHTNTVRSVVFHPNGRWLLSGSSDETVKVWDLHGGQCVATLRAPRPYEGMCITGAVGLTAAQKAALKALGAVE